MAQENTNPNWGEIQDKLQDMLIIFEDLADRYEYQETLIKASEGTRDYFSEMDIRHMYATLNHMYNIANDIFEQGGICIAE